jgi:hypothetical protein
VNQDPVLGIALPVVLGMLLRQYRPALCARHEFAMTRVPFLMLPVFGWLGWQRLRMS